MKLIIALACLMSTTAFAYEEGTYRCKNSDKTLPDNEYKIEMVNVGNVSLPYVESTKHFRRNADDVTSDVMTSTLKGLATVANNGDTEILMLGAFRFEFVKGEFINCKR